MNSVYHQATNLYINNITLEEFKEKIKINGNTFLSYDPSSTMIFNWGEIEHVIIEDVKSLEMKTFDKIPMNRLKATISSAERSKIIENLTKNPQEKNDTKDFIHNTKIEIIVIEKDEGKLLLVIKGNDDTKSSIRCKLLGESTSNKHIKKTWKNNQITLPENVFDLDFLIWLISKKGLQISYSNLDMVINDVTYLADTGGRGSNINRRGKGRDLMNDPIAKAIIAGIDSVETIGLKIDLEYGNLDFRLHKNGELQINSDSSINIPNYRNFGHEEGFTYIVYNIYCKIIPNLLNYFKNDKSWNEDAKNNLKRKYFSESIIKISEGLGIEIENNLVDDETLKKIILE